MMSYKRKAATLFFVSILLQGCIKGPPECEEADGKDLETCKKCVEKAQKTSDPSAKKEQLKVCAQAAKESKTNQATTAKTTTKKPSFQQIAETVVGNAAKASLAVASSAIQTSVPIELAASSRSTGRSVGHARARQKMAEQVRSGTREGQENPYSGIETQLPANTPQAMENVFKDIESLPAAKIAGVTSGTGTGQDNAFNGEVESQPVANTAQVRSLASAGRDSPYSFMDSQPDASTAQVRSAASAGQDSPYNVIETQPATKAAQLNDVTSGWGNLSKAEPHLQANPVQANAAAVETEASAAAGATAKAVEAETQSTSGGGIGSDDFFKPQFQQVANSARVDVQSTGQDLARRSAESQLQAATLPAKVQPQTDPAQAKDTVMHSLQNGQTNETSDDVLERKKPTTDPKVDVLATAAQAILPVLQQAPADDALKDLVGQQKSTDPEAIAEISSQPWPPSDPRYNKSKTAKQPPESLEQVGNSNVQKQATVDAQQQERTNSVHSDVQEQAIMDTHKQDLMANSDNYDDHEQRSFQAVVGTSGKVAHVRKPRHGA